MRNRAIEFVETARHETARSVKDVPAPPPHPFFNARAALGATPFTAAILARELGEMPQPVCSELPAANFCRQLSIPNPMHKPLLAIAALAFPLVGLSASDTPINAYSRQSLALNGKWNVIVDPYETGFYDYRYEPYDQNPNATGGFYLDHQPADKSELVEYNFDRSPTLMVPGDWNSQSEKFFYYEGSIWYRRLFDVQPQTPGRRLFLYFGAANYEADVYLNGKKLGRHVGGFTPFSFEITHAVRASGNSLVVKVDNKRHREGVPTLNTDWWNYGGLTRDVMILETPATFITDYSIQLQKGSLDHVSGFIRLNGPGKVQKGQVTIPELGTTVDFTTDRDGFAQINFPLQQAQLWSPTNPKLYDVAIACETDRVAEKIGFRSIEVKGTEILLNGRPLFLRGICLHEENPLRGGRARSPEDSRQLLGWAKELNCNFLRLAHYPHNESMARTADEMGLLLWEEIPVYWTIQWENPATLENAKNQLGELIGRDKNRASVIVWSVANETPVSEPRTAFLKQLIGLARTTDPTRLVSSAMEVHPDRADAKTLVVDDPLGESTDLTSFNEYIGWYVGQPALCAEVKWVIKSAKPVLITELGGGALQGLHGDAQTRFTEEFQEELYRQNLQMLAKIPQLRGTAPWILVDFRSPKRTLPGIQDGWNRKGLIGENGTKKKAFYVLKQFYDEKAAAQP